MSRRDISPVLQKVREMLLMRKYQPALRFEDQLSDRSQPQPNLPDGIAHQLANNYYYNRDARRLVQPPKNLLSQQNLISEKDSSTTKLPTPGKVFHWD